MGLDLKNKKMATKFVDISDDFKIRMCTSPQAVFTTQDPDDETREQVIERQENFLKLPENIKDKLVASETAEKIKAIGAHYNLELLQMAPIARVVRSYYFGEVKLEDFANIIEKESKVAKEISEIIARYVIDRIINRDIKLKAVAKKEQLTIGQILEKYPEIKKKALTSSQLELERRIVNPTFENWISDYFNIVGAGNRDVMKRSSYIYHSKNTKSLNMIDRQKLSSVLKSLDDGSLLDVDVDKKEIVFNLLLTENKNKPAIYQTAPLGQNNIQAPLKTDKTVATNKRFIMDGFMGADKKEESELEKKEIFIAPDKASKKTTRTDEINLPYKGEDRVGKINTLDFLVGGKKREEFDKKITENSNDNVQENVTFLKNSTPVKSEETKEEKTKESVPSEKRGNEKMTISHVRGNNWDLGSAHFLKKDRVLEKSANEFSSLKKENETKNLDRVATSDIGGNNIKFTSPQQLPVEKENDNTTKINKVKTEETNSFLGKIRPIE